MASRFQRGSLRQETRRDGKVWKLRYYTSRPKDGTRIERTLLVGYVRDYPTLSDAWREVDRQHLTDKINNERLQPGKLTFRQIAEHYIDNDLLNPQSIRRKAETTQYCSKHNIRDYLVKRWGDVPAIEIKPAVVEDWLHALSLDRNPDGLSWPTLSKIRSTMSIVYAHAQRNGFDT